MNATSRCSMLKMMVMLASLLSLAVSACRPSFHSGGYMPATSGVPLDAFSRLGGFQLGMSPGAFRRTLKDLGMARHRDHKWKQIVKGRIVFLIKIIGKRRGASGLRKAEASFVNRRLVSLKLRFRSGGRARFNRWRMRFGKPGRVNLRHAQWLKGDIHIKAGTSGLRLLATHYGLARKLNFIQQGYFERLKRQLTRSASEM